MPPLAGSWPYSGSLAEPPFSSLNAELADISAAAADDDDDDAERRRAPETESRVSLRGAEADRAEGARMRHPCSNLFKLR